MHPNIRTLAATLLAPLFLTVQSTAAVLFTESFETDGQGVRYTASQPFNDGVNDHWNRTDGSDISNASGVAYNGQDGSFYWAAEDVDDNGGNGLDEQTFDITGIHIAGFENLQFSGLFAADGQPSIYQFDSTDHVHVLYSVDGGPLRDGLWFSYENLGDAFNERLLLDTDFDGNGDSTQPTPTFRAFGFAIPNGSALDLQIRVRMDGSSEEVAFDNLRLTGDPVLVNLAPIASSASAPDVGEPEIGDTVYSFTVTYGDNSAVDVSTIDASDVAVSGPGGSLNVVGVTVQPGTDGTPRTATYTATPPGGSWDATDTGTYSVVIGVSQVGDDGAPQLFVASGSVATFSVDAVNTPPMVDHVLAEKVTAADFGNTSYSFTIQYSDVGGIDVSSIDASDVAVTGPGVVTVTGGSESSGTDGSPKMATYTLTPPGGAWDATDAGTYTIELVGSQVFDVAGAAAPANASLATFEVDASLLFSESFETDGQGTRYTATTPFNDGPDDHWNRTDGSDTANSSAAYTGQDGMYHWAAEDTDRGGMIGPLQSIEFSGIGIVGFRNLQFTGLFGADGFSGGVHRFDADDFIKVLYSVDGGPFSDGLWFRAAGAVSQQLLQDTDFDGVGDGTALGPAFQSFGFVIPNGSTLALKVEVRMDAGAEEIAFDLLEVGGGVVAVNQPPFVGGSVLPDVGEPEVGATSYAFTVTYSDNSAIDVSTLDPNDVSVTGPGGSITVTGATPDPGTDGTPRTATYTATPPGGGWDAADSGTYTVALESNEVGDDGAPQLFAAAVIIGTFDVNAVNAPPVVDRVLAAHVTAREFGQGAYSFTVEYSDGGGLDVSSIDVNDVTVTGPGGLLTVTSGTETSGVDGSPRTATYTVSPPGGVWDVTDDGTYTIGMVGGEVLDVVGAAVAADPALATFRVDSEAIFWESFETDGQGTRYTASQPFNDGVNDHWNRTDGADISNSSSPYGGQHGRYYWAAEDTDDDGGNGNPVQTMEFAGIDIANHHSLRFSGLFAADGPAGNPQFDAIDFIRVFYSVDGGALRSGVWFSYENNGSPFNELLRLDTDFDGNGDGATLVPTFAAFGFDVLNGTTLDLRIEVRADGGAEEIAFDELHLSGTFLPREFDFGDAPDPLAATPGEYPTLLASDGARHLIPSGGPTLFLGAVGPDGEADGQPDANATGDDLNGPLDDEDGVTLPVAFTSGTSASLGVVASGPGLLNAWIDWNRNGNWTDPGEQVFTDQAVVGGPNPLMFNVPALSVGGKSFARFRVDSVGGLAPTGEVAGGEVEDYAVELNRPPIATGDTIERYPTQPVKVEVSDLLADDTDPDGDPVGFVGVTSPSTNGGQVLHSGDRVFYTPPAGFLLADSFVYTIQDGKGGVSMGTVQVNIVQDNRQSMNIVGINESSPGTFAIAFTGIPGLTYTIQFTETLDGSGESTSWTTVGTATADAVGMFGFSHTPSPPGTTGFYRAVFP